MIGVWLVACALVGRRDSGGPEEAEARPACRIARVTWSAKKRGHLMRYPVLLVS